jgi:outer membrane protein assembly factor BamD
MDSRASGKASSNNSHERIGRFFFDSALFFVLRSRRERKSSRNAGWFFSASLLTISRDLYNIHVKFEPRLFIMRTEMFVPGALLVALLASGCASLSAPSLPSLPWSKPTPVVDPTAEALFEEGMRYFKDKRYVRALDAFTKLKTEHPFSPLLTETELRIADAYYLNEQYPEAVNAFKEFQSLHPTSEQVPFVVLRLGQAHFDQFSNVNRDQKNTEIAKGYFEAVLTNYPKSPHAVEAKEKLAKCNGILAEHEFNIAEFYFKQEKYPAARDRFEEIVRKYPGTPVASRSLFFLGQSYQKEKNNVKAALAYEALLSHYPQDQFSGAARTQLAQMEKEKHDPLAMLLMRDRRPVVAPAQAKPETAVAAKAKEANNLVAKTEVVYEAPGDEKTMFRKVVDKINPFSSSGNGKDDEKKKPEEKPKSAVELLAKNNGQKTETESKGFFASLWPFGGETKTAQEPGGGKGTAVLDRVDDSLKQKGIDTNTQAAALKPPAIDLPNVDDLQPKPASDSSKLLGQIDSTLKKEGKDTDEPKPPEAAEVFKNPEMARAAVARGQPRTDGAEQSSVASGLLGSIDQKLKGKGVEPGNFEPAPTGKQVEAKPATPKEINLEPKVVKEKGPLFLNPGETPEIQQPAAEASKNDTAKPEGSAKTDETVSTNISRSLVRGPQPPANAAPATKPDEQKSPTARANEESKGAFEQLQQDLDSVGKLLNPFRW